MFTSRIAAITFASLTALSTACAMNPSPEADVAPIVVPTKVTVQKSIRLGDDATIAARRAAIAPKRKMLLGDAQTPAVQRFIASSTTFAVDPSRANALSVSLLRGDGRVEDVVATVSSSDPSVGVATLEDGRIVVSPTGKLGNTYVTTYDAQGNATEKFMVLSASPKPGTLIVEDAKLVPAKLVTADGRQATDFQSSDADAMGDLTQTAGWMYASDPNALASAIQSARAAAGVDIQAIYYPDLDVLVRLEGAARQGAMSLTSQGFAFKASLVTQGDFEQYVDDGGNLSSSPLRDADATDAGELELSHARFASTPIVKAVVLKNGQRLAGNDPSLEAHRSEIASYDLTYPALGDEKKGGLECGAEKNVDVDWSAIASFETKVDAQASWNHGSPNVQMTLHPHVRVGGELKLSAPAELKCEVELFKIPLAEWGVPLLGKVKVEIPVKFEVKFGVDGKATVITPRVEMGSKDDVTKPGSVGFAYTADGGFRGISDIAVRTTESELKLATGTDSPKVGAHLTAGVGAGLELSAEVKTWLFKASVSASIVDVMFGSQHSGTFVMNSDRTGYHVEAGDENGLGLFVEFKPTLNVNVGWFHNSFRLFTVDVKPLWIMHQAPVSADRPMVDVQDVTTSAGPATLYSDALVMKDAKSTWGGDVVLVRGSDEFRLKAKNGELNLAGMPLKSGDQLFSSTTEYFCHPGSSTCQDLEHRSLLLAYTKP